MARTVTHIGLYIIHEILDSGDAQVKTAKVLLQARVLSCRQQDTICYDIGGRCTYNGLQTLYE